jgi:mono/diheme cytochrome c family protein
MSRFRTVAALLLVPLFGPSAEGADATNGEQLARRWCAECHLVAPDQRRAAADVPPFAVLASKPDFSAERLVYFLLEPHPKMPNLALSRAAAADLAAYIASLRN